MKNYYKLLIFITVTLSIGIILTSFAPEYFTYIKSTLISFKKFCHSHPLASYLLYTGIFVIILSLGLPFTCAAMLLAGVTYKLWEAALLILICRVTVAIIVFILARHILFQAPKKYQKKPAIVKKFDKYPTLGLFLMRISPIPDNAVNYSMGTSSIKGINYILISLMTMIPSAIIWASIGNELGSVSALVKFLS